MTECYKEIPHIIHYFWFGKNEKPKIVLDCIDSWKKYFPGWKIIEWNEENYDLDKSIYMKEAYSQRKWAFVSDYARFDVLYEYGGIYLDVDVEFIKKLPESFLQEGPFTGFEHTGIVAPGLIFAIYPKHPFIKEVIKMFNNSTFKQNPDGSYLTVNMQLTNLMKKNGLQTNNKLQKVCGITIYPSEFFCGYNTDIREPDITSNTICWHHYLGSWQKKSLKVKIQDFLKKMIGVKNYKLLIIFKRKHIRSMWNQE